VSLSDTDKREVCPQHGWVGRKRFQQERHDLCEAPRDTYEDEDDQDEDSDADDEPSVADFVDEADADADPEVDAVDPDERWSRAAARRKGDAPYDRPKTRADCARVPRPCPYVACKYSLYLDVSETGSIILNFPHLEPGEMPPHQSCALDLAERGAMTLEDIAVVTNLTRERIRQVELKALVRRARPAAVAMGLGPEDAAALGARHRVGPGADLEETGVEGAVPSDVATLLISGGGGSGGGNNDD
jgi:hypothetical protein